MQPQGLDIDKLFDANAYWLSGTCPWTFFAYPNELRDELGLPPDDDAKRLLVELGCRGIRAGIWSNSPMDDTTYFACPKEDIARLNEALAELENNGDFEVGFCGKRTEELFDRVNRQG